MNLKLFISLLLLLFPVFSVRAAAYERGVVKGDSGVVAVSNFNISEGPGFFLPSSPLYFLDLFFNSLKVKMAASPTDEVKRRLAIAAERFVEIKIALEANNPKGLDATLANLNEQLDGIRSVFIKEKAAGRSVSVLAEETVSQMDLDYQALVSLMAVSNDVMVKKLEATENVLSEAEDSVIEALPQLTREKARIRKLTREVIKDSQHAEAKISLVNGNAKEIMQEASRSMQLRKKATGSAEPTTLTLYGLKPIEETITQSEKALEEAGKTIEKASELNNFDVDKLYESETESEKIIQQGQGENLDNQESAEKTQSVPVNRKSKN